MKAKSVHASGFQLGPLLWTVFGGLRGPKPPILKLLEEPSLRTRTPRLRGRLLETLNSNLSALAAPKKVREGKCFQLPKLKL